MRETIGESLKLLGLDRVDLWLIHWPPHEDAIPATWGEFEVALVDPMSRHP